MAIFRYITFLFIFTLLLFPGEIKAEQKPELLFFYSETCTHCATEQNFLDNIEKKYPELSVIRHSIHERKNVKLLEEIAPKYNAERYIGQVPLTFVGDDFFLGFDNANGIGKKIENSIIKILKDRPQPTQTPENPDLIYVPLLEDIDPAKYSLPALAVTLGFLDGFNVCSLGALILILGLVLMLKSRKKIFLFGGIFVLTTAVIYGILIVLWYKLFSFFSSYLRLMEILIGAIGIGGALYFFKEFYRFKKHGPTCAISEGNSIIGKMTLKVQNAFQNPKNIWSLIMGVLVFATVLTIVEFPCSAAIPVVFAGILSKAQLPGILYLLYISIFILLYLLDELLVFAIAAFTMKLWLTSPKFTTWITFVEAVILAILGLYYLI